MAQNEKDSDAQARREWSDIQQADRRGATTAVARRRRTARIWRMAGLGTLAAVLCVSLVTAYVSASRSATALEPSAFLEKVTFRTDGVLTDRWLSKALDIREGMAMGSIDVTSIRRRLEESGQIKSASVTLRLPSELSIEVREKIPILRASAQTSDGAKLLLISDDGAIFEGANYPLNTLRALPYVDGVSFRMRGDGYEPVADAAPVAAFLSTARARWPKIYRDWTIVSLKRYKGLSQGSVIEVKSRTLGTLQFTPDNVEDQLRRLFGALAGGALNDPRQVTGVNLTIPGQAIFDYGDAKVSGKTQSSKPQGGR
jgi:cell division septal protein FtsQ